MSSLNQENSPKHNKESILVAKQQLDTIGHESDSDNGIFDNNIAFNQSDHSSSVTPSVHSGSNDHSDVSDESDEEILIQNNSKRILYRNMILYFGREFVVFLILLLTTFATYHNL